MTHKNITPDMFKQIDFPQKDISGLQVSKYRIYTDHSHFILVEADNAQAAINASGMTSPVKVLRDSIYLQNVMMLDSITAQVSTQQDNAPVEKQPAVQETQQATTTDEVPASKQHEQALAANEPASSEPEGALSSEEVDKLLKPSS